MPELGPAGVISADCYNDSMEFNPDQRRQALQAFLTRTGLKPTAWEAAAGLGEGVVRKYLKRPTGSMSDRTYAALSAAAAKLGHPVSVDELKGSQDYHKSASEALSPEPHAMVEDRQRIVDHSPLPPREKDDPGIPVLGTSLAGSEGDFQMNSGEIDRVRTPPRLKDRKGVFALYVEGESMRPWRRPGQIVLCDDASNKRAQIGDHVVVEMKATPPDEDRPAFLKLLVGRSASKLKLKQYNPEKTFDVPLLRVHKVHRVLEMDDIIGT